MQPNKEYKPNMITKAQIRFIKTMQRKNQSDDEYYEMLENRFGVSSCTQLTCKQARELIELYNTWGYATAKKKTRKRTPTIPRKKRDGGNKIIRLISASEKKKIIAISALINWMSSEDIENWMEGHFGITRVRTGQDAFLVIEGLKKMFENRMKKKHGPQWWQKSFSDLHVRRYISEHCPEEYR